MTTEERLVKLEEAMLVSSALLNRLDQQGEGHKEWLAAHNAAVQRHDEELAELRQSQIALHEEQRKTEQSLQIMTAGINALRETVDRFIQGKDGNGRKQ